MQWNDEAEAGFTTGQPWLAVNPNYKEINVEAALADPTISIPTKPLIALRKEYPWLVTADYELVDAADKVFAYKGRKESKPIWWLSISPVKIKTYRSSMGLKRPYCQYQGRTSSNQQVGPLGCLSQTSLMKVRKIEEITS